MCSVEMWECVVCGDMGVCVVCGDVGVCSVWRCGSVCSVEMWECGDVLLSFVGRMDWTTR